MAQDYDVVLKLLFRSQSSQAVREIAGAPVKRWLDKELPSTAIPVPTCSGKPSAASSFIWNS